MKIDRRVRRIVLGSLVCLGVASRAGAQCLDWKDSFEFSPAGVGYTGYPAPSVSALLSWDDGTGPSLYVAGRFSDAGGVAAGNVARWDGSEWFSLGNLPAQPYALLAFDDGNGPAVVAAGFAPGSYDRVFRWDGSNWSPLGDPDIAKVHALAAFDDGSGMALYAGGWLGNCLSRWNGTSWSTVGGGVYGSMDPNSGTTVRALTVFDDGSGPALFAAGTFQGAGGATVNGIAKWNGSTWSGLAGGTGGSLSDSINALAVYDDGSGAHLYAGGLFSSIGGGVAHDVARWNGTSWSAVGSGFNPNYVNGLGVSDQEGVQALYAVGLFGNAYSMNRWDGTAWTPKGGRLRKPTYDFADFGVALCVASFDDGSGSAVYCGGDFLAEDQETVLNSIAKWNGSSWSRLGAPTERGTDQSVRELSVLTFGGETSLHAAGAFVDAGGLPCQRVARWNGEGWTPLGDGLYAFGGEVDALEVFGASIYAGGSFAEAGENIARWNGTQWLSVGGGTSGPVHALVTHADGTGTHLYAGGDFVFAGGSVVSHLVKWNGSAWSPVGGMGAAVRALASFDDGNGPALFAGGDFTTAGPIAASHIAKRVNSTWQPVGIGLDGPAHCFLVFDDGGGPALYVGGEFLTAGGAPANRVAKWNGIAWTPLGSGFDATVLDFAVHDDGNGPALYASGEFTASGSTPMSRLARWTGTTWRSVGSGANAPVRAIASFDDGSGGGADLWVGGDFTATAEIPSSHVGVWRGCAGPVSGMCYGDGTVAPCPCGNQGDFRHGCNNSIQNGGARLFASGTSAPDTLVLHSVGELPTALSIFLQGNALIYETVVFGDGLRCAGGALKRLYVRSASGGMTVAPQGADPSITARSAALGDVIPAGGTRYYQTYYRDANPSFCAAPQGSTFNATNGLRVVW